MKAELLATLSDMLTYCRPSGSETERDFILQYIAPLPGASVDPFGNWIVRVGESPILWSSHTDTVHKRDGYQTLRINHSEQTIRLSRRSKRDGRNCLGADDTVGVFIMREMILRGVPGLYIFHSAEEIGGKGSQDLADYTPHVLTGIRFAIALDRAGVRDIITSQMFGVCASSAFVSSLAPMLPGLYSGASGSFTDTANYTHLVSECSNLSVGYYNQHKATEWVDFAHVARLLDSLTRLDPALLVSERDPHATGWSTDYSRGVSTGSLSDSWASMSRRSTRYDDLADDVWCVHCDAPILQADEMHLLIVQSDYCQCHELDVDVEATADDQAFLAYLLNRDEY